MEKTGNDPKGLARIMSTGWRRIVGTASALVVAGFAHGAMADAVYFRDGGTLQGTVQTVGEEMLTLTLTEGGVVQVPLSALAHVRVRDLNVLEGSPLDPTPDPTPEPGTTYSGSVEAGLSLLEGNREKQSIYAKSKLTVDFGRDRLRLEGRLDQEQAEGTVVTDKYRVALAYDLFLTDRLFLAPQVAVHRDDEALLDREVSAGVQLGYQVIETDATSLAVRLGPTWVRREEHGAAEAEDLARALASVEAKHALTVTTDLVFEARSATDLSDNAGRTDLDLEAGATVDLLDSLYLKAAYVLAYDSDPPLGVEAADHTYRMTLGYGF